MPDPIDPFVEAEFEKPIQSNKTDDDESKTEAFQKEYEKKARSVQEKDKSNQTRQDHLENKELVSEKPIIDEKADTTSSKLDSILDINKPTSFQKKTTPIRSENAPTPSTAPIDTKGVDFSDSNDDLTKKLTDAPGGYTANQPTSIFSQKTDPMHLLTSTNTVNAKGNAASTAPVQEKPISPEAGQLSNQKPAPKQDLSKTDQTPQTHQSLTDNPTTKPGQTPSAHRDTFSSVNNTFSSKPTQTDEHAKLPQTSPHTHPAKDTSLEETHLASSNQESSRSIPSDAVPTEEPPLTEKEKEQVAPLFSLPMEAKKDLSSKTSKTEEDKVKATSKIESPPESDFLEQEKKDEEGQEKAEKELASQDLLSNIFPDTSSSVDSSADTLKTATGFDRLPPQVLQLFDRLVGVITVLQVQGKSETTFHLTQKDSDLLKNTSITITTYDTAPLAYNIELKGTAESTAFLQKNVDGLKKAFKDPKKKFNFGVHDIMISLNKQDTTT